MPKNIPDGSLAIIQGNSLRYPEAWNRLDATERNSWFPNQIQMSFDTYHYRQVMSDNLRKVFRIGLARLSTSDVQIGENISLAIMPRMWQLGLFGYAPEPYMFLQRQAYEEANHTKSYQHILESLAMESEEQADVWALWETAPPMREWAEFAAEQTVVLGDLATPMDTSDFLLRWAFYGIIYEGLVFYENFNVLFAIGNWNRVEGHPMCFGTQEQLQYIRRDETNHVDFCNWAINQLKNEGHRFPEGEFISLLHKACEYEEAYINWLLPEPILGYNATDHMMHFRNMANRRARRLGCGEVFLQEKDPFPWLSGFVDMQKLKNFFETHVEDYQTGAPLKWDES